MFFFSWADVRKLSKTKLPTSNFSILQIFNPTFSSMPFHAGSNPAVVFLSWIDKKLLKLKHSSLDEKTHIFILKWRYITNYRFVLIAANIRHIWILIIVNFRLYQSTHVCNLNFFDFRENVFLLKSFLFVNHALCYVNGNNSHRNSAITWSIWQGAPSWYLKSDLPTLCSYLTLG